jgi:hypothetical protein
METLSPDQTEKVDVTQPIQSARPLPPPILTSQISLMPSDTPIPIVGTSVLANPPESSGNGRDCVSAAAWVGRFGLDAGLAITQQEGNKTLVLACSLVPWQGWMKYYSTLQYLPPPPSRSISLNSIRLRRSRAVSSLKPSRIWLTSFSE